MSNDSYVQLAPDAGGKKVKNVLLTGVPQSDGTYADVYVQCNAVVDTEGRIIDNDAVLETLQSIKRELSLIRQAMGELIDDASYALEDTDESEEDND